MRIPSRRKAWITATHWPHDPQRFHGRCVAVTSLSPATHRQQRQRLCIESWKSIGLPVIAVNSSVECELLSGQYPGVEFRACDDLATDYDRPTQRVSTLIQTAIEISLPVLLINSDIQILGNPQVLMDLLDKDKLTIGVRYNHAPGQLHTAIREPWGLDAFVFTPEMAAKVPTLPFGLGKPVWDWWLPHHFRTLGYGFNWINSPWLFHENHDRAWSLAEWDRGAAWMRDLYDLDLKKCTHAFRRGLR